MKKALEDSRLAIYVSRHRLTSDHADDDDTEDEFEVPDYSIGRVWQPNSVDLESFATTGHQERRGKGTTFIHWNGTFNVVNKHFTSID